MFRHRESVIFIFVTLCLFGLWWFWSVPPKVTLESSQPVISGERWRIDLSGDFGKYSSLGEAWKKQQVDTLYLPSNEDFQVAVKRFQLSGEWAARTARLIINGLQGDVTIYLNGIDGAHRIGRLSGGKGEAVLDIPASVFNYGAENILIIRTDSGDEIRGLRADKRAVYGNIYLEAVGETTVNISRCDIQWEENLAHLQITALLEHHNILEKGPWAIMAKLSDGSTWTAEQTAELNADGNTLQPVILELDIPDARKWSLAEPFLYDLKLTVINNQGGKDELETKIGLAGVAYQAGKMLISGQENKINGIALTKEKEQELRGSGQINGWMTEEKEKGINLIYFLDQYPDELWFQEADRLGMGIWAEAPNSLILAQDLIQPEQFLPMIESGNRHPSLWAWTAGKGIQGTEGEIATYLKNLEIISSNQPFFFLSNKGMTVLPGEKTIVPHGSTLQSDWGEITLYSEAETRGKWGGEKQAATLWAFLIVVIILCNIRSLSWRYKEIGLEKPKRRLRWAWRWHRLALFGRAGTLGGIITSLLFTLPYSLGPWFEQDNILIQITRQSPWLIWLTLTAVLIILRWIQLGVAVPFLPDKPHPLGLAYWLERRYRWIALTAILWAVSAWGFPVYIPFLSYVVLTLLFFPVRVRDIHKAGGRYVALLITPFVWGCFLMAGLFILRNELYYLYLFYR